MPSRHTGQGVARDTRSSPPELWYKVGMAEMLKTVPLLFGLPTASSELQAAAPRRVNGSRTNIGRFRSTAMRMADGADQRAAQLDGPSPRAELGSQVRAALQSGGRRLLLRHFLAEVGKVLGEQETVLGLLDQSRAWSLSVLNRQFYAIRSAATVLGLRNLAQVAGRAEVLVNLLDSGSVTYNQNHGAVIVETHRLLRALVERLLDSASDENCHSIAQTVWSLHAALEGNVCAYEPGESEHSVAQSTHGVDWA